MAIFYYVRSIRCTDTETENRQNRDRKNKSSRLTLQIPENLPPGLQTVSGKQDRAMGSVTIELIENM